MSQISRDNCCTYMEHILTCRDFADIKVRYEGYGFTLDYKGSDDEYWEEFESMLKLFSEKVIKSYREFKNFVPDSYYENCFDAMVEDFEIHACPFGTLCIGQPHF